MEYVVLRTGGKQYRVSKDSIITIERLNLKPKDSFDFEDILLYVKDGTLNLGRPKSLGISVKGRILESVKGEKIKISKFKAKSKYRRMTGHRQSLSKVKIEDIVSKASS